MGARARADIVGDGAQGPEAAAEGPEVGPGRFVGGEMPVGGAAGHEEAPGCSSLGAPPLPPARTRYATLRLLLAW